MRCLCRILAFKFFIKLLFPLKHPCPYQKNYFNFFNSERDSKTLLTSKTSQGTTSDSTSNR